jgi:hypothetical protein
LKVPDQLKIKLRNERAKDLFKKLDRGYQSLLNKTVETGKLRKSYF